jgi:DNA repair exonuclease SbcCD ATPase subunit
MKIKTKFRTLKKIYHISDIQIRNLKRHAEYEAVFNRTYKFIKQDTENAVIYIGGDIAHSKTDMSPELVDQLSRLFANLADLCPTIIIAGNHDCNLNNRSRLDVLTPIVSNLDHPDLYYFKDTGVYSVGDVDFAVLDVWDSLKNLPNPKKMTAKTKVLLYHGTVDKSQTDLGFALPSAVKTRHFNGYDMVLLGDIHKMQTLQEYRPEKIIKPVIRYCGSLVQQNHGETLKGHGVSVWDVKNRSFIHREINNDYGYYTIEIEDGLVPDADDIPKHARLRVRVKNTSSTDLKKALTIIRHRHNLKEVVVQNMDNFKVDDGDSSQVDFGDLSDPNVQSTLICDYLKNNTTVSAKILEKVKKINAELSTLIADEGFQRNVNWKLKKFDFKNMFAYGENNSIDFTRCNGIVGMFSPNASGKSSVLDALTFCLFDKSTRAWRAEQVMNFSKSEFECKVEFEIGNETYFIERYGYVTRRGATKVDVDFYKIDEDGEKVSLNGDQRASTNKAIRSIIGTYEDFILTSFSSQTNSSVFLDHNQTERKEILAKFLGLSVFDQLYVMAQRESSGLQSMLKNFLDVDYDSQINDIEISLKKAIEEIGDLQLKVDNKDSELKDVELETVNLMKSLKPIDSSVEDVDVLSVNLTDTEIIIKEIEESISSFTSDMTNLESDITNVGNRLESSKFIDIAKRMADYNFVIDKKNNTKSDVDKLKIEVKTKLDKISRLGNLEYDPNCTYCMDNVFVKDAINTKQELENDRERASKLVGLLKTLENKIEIDSDIPETYNEHKQLSLEATQLVDQQRRVDVEIKGYKALGNQKQNTLDIIVEKINKSKRYKTDLEFNEELQKSIDAKNVEKLAVEVDIKNMNTDMHQFIGRKVNLETKKSEIFDTINKVKSLEEKYDAYKYYLMAVNKDGVAYDLISKILSTVEVEVNDILSQIVDFTILFEMDGKSVNNYICYGDDKSWALELASGMERFISSLAIRIALTNISNLPRANFIAIDEGWGTLDSDNLNSVYQLFQYLRTVYQFSLIISHIDAMRDFTDDLLEIEIDNGYSKINF